MTKTNRTLGIPNCNMPRKITYEDACAQSHLGASTIFLDELLHDRDVTLVRTMRYAYPGLCHAVRNIHLINSSWLLGQTSLGAPSRLRPASAGTSSI